MVPISHWIVPTSHIMVLISHLIVPIEWVPYPQKECEYCRMTHEILVLSSLEFYNSRSSNLN